MPALQAVLDGTYVVPQDSNSATWDLFAEKATIRHTVPKDSKSISMSPAQCSMETILENCE